MKIITRVATLFDNKVISLPEPYRHHHLFRMMKDNPEFPRWNPRTGTPDVQGFITAAGMFVDRFDAYSLFMEYGQKEYDQDRGGMLYSENCWPSIGNWAAAKGTPERDLHDHKESLETMEALVKIEPFVGSIKPYRIETVIADIFHREGVAVRFKPMDFETRVADTLYSQLFTEPIADDKTVNDLNVRLSTYLSLLRPSDNRVHD